MHARRGISGERIGGAIALAFILGFVALALAPLLRFGGAGGIDQQLASVLTFTLWQASLSTLLSVFLEPSSRFPWRGGRVSRAGVVAALHGRADGASRACRCFRRAGGLGAGRRVQ